MNISAYIKYWNNVVRAWLDYDLFDKDLRKEKEQVLCHSILSKVLRTHHVPGPYMGNPKKASIVILNYNPGGSSDNDYTKCHQCLRCNRNYYSVINYIDRHGYSGFAEDFPYLNDNVSEELKRSLDGGKKWWLKKKKWIDNLTSAYCSEESNDKKETKRKSNNNKRLTKFPFAMEVCGWHSKKWSANVLKKLNNNLQLEKHIEDTVVEPMIEVISCNNTFGICIGKELGDMLIGFKFHNITNLLSNHLKQINIPFAFLNNYINVQLDKQNNLIVPKASLNNKKGRNYRLLKYGNREDGSVYIINTWVNGSNKHPSKALFNFEKEIVNFIKTNP